MKHPMLAEKEAIARQTKRTIVNSSCPIKYNPYKSSEKDGKVNKNEANWRFLRNFKIKWNKSYPISYNIGRSILC
jgi:hypothetical protein